MKSNQFCDVDFLVGGNIEKLTRIPAHIAIVVARSDWLRTKIRNERARLKTMASEEDDSEPNKLKQRLEVMQIPFLKDRFFTLFKVNSRFLNRNELLFLGTFT